MKGNRFLQRALTISGEAQVAAVFVFFTLVIIFGSAAWGQSVPNSRTSTNQPAESTGRPDEQGEPIHISSDRLEVDNKVRKAHFYGDVRAQQGDITLYSDELLVTYGSEKPQMQSPSSKKKTEQFLPGGAEGERIEKIIAKGHVRLIQGNRTAEGEQAIFYNLDQKIVLTGNPVIRRARDHISGERITVFLDKEISIVEGKGEARVQAVIYPEKRQEGRPGERR